MMPKFRNFRAVPNVMFAKGAIGEVPNLLKTVRHDEGYCVFIIDHFFQNGFLTKKLGIQGKDILFYLDTTNEPKTSTVDEYVATIKDISKALPDAVIGIGGGSAMDVAKAVAIMMTNEGKTEQYQGWDLVVNRPVYKIGIPTISGTGSEVSKTAVLTGPVKKQGINSEYSIFDQIVLDPDLLKTVPPKQRFFTGMDCYVHSIEAISGTFLNEFSKAFAEKALDLCKRVFMGNGNDADLMVASYLGGYSIVYSEVGVCHALSYGLSYIYGLHHGEAISTVFNYLENYYPEHIKEFHEMLEKNGVELQHNIVQDITDKAMNKMIELTYLMEKPLYNALGENWRERLTEEKIKELYLKM